MNIIDRLNSGELHSAARADRPECVDGLGNIHATPERAAFVDWRRDMAAEHGDNPADWPEEHRAEYERRYVPSY
tara:strand:+ start:172 stop:393 length:222 start_codon:yes stop_codon:yes gene_type:complete